MQTAMSLRGILRAAASLRAHFCMYTQTVVFHTTRVPSSVKFDNDFTMFAERNVYRGVAALINLILTVIRTLPCFVSILL